MSGNFWPNIHSTQILLNVHMQITRPQRTNMAPRNKKNFRIRAGEKTWGGEKLPDPGRGENLKDTK